MMEGLFQPVHLLVIVGVAGIVLALVIIALFMNSRLKPLKAAAEASRKESGNLAFDALQQSARTNHFEVVEVWKNRKAEDAHEIAPETKDYRAKLAPLIGARYDRRWYRPL